MNNIELHEPRFPSTAVHSIGWEPIKSGLRGNVHVQFHKDGKLTQRGYFKAVQRPIYAGLDASQKPGAFIHQNLRNHFEWIRSGDDEIETEMLANLDPTLPLSVYIPKEVENTVEAITACLDSQRIQPERKGLFE